MKSEENFYTPNTLEIKILMVKKGWTLETLARKTRLSLPCVHQVINGKRPRSKMMPKIAKALGVPLSDIIIQPVAPVDVAQGTEGVAA